MMVGVECPTKLFQKRLFVMLACAKDYGSLFYIIPREIVLEILHLIFCIIPDGTLVFQFGDSDTKGNIKLKKPRGIEIDKKNNRIFVTCGSMDSHDTHSIQVCTLLGKYLCSFGDLKGKVKGLYCPTGMCYDHKSNRLYVCDMLNWRILIFDEQGNYISHFGAQMKYGIPFLLWGVTINSYGQLFTTNNSDHRIRVYDLNGKYLYQFGSEGTGDTQFNSPHGIWASNVSDRLFICDNNNERIQVYSQSEGEFLYSIQDDIWRIHPMGICGDDDENIFVSEPEGYITIYSGDGEYIHCFGNRVEFYETPKMSPWDLVIDDDGLGGGLYVCDNQWNRIQVYV